MSVTFENVLFSRVGIVFELAAEMCPAFEIEVHTLHAIPTLQGPGAIGRARLVSMKVVRVALGMMWRYFAL